MSVITRDSAVLEQVRAEQVRTLYGQSTPVLLANVVNAVIVSIALWSQASHALLVGWTAVISELGRGSRFEIVLPYHAAAADHAAKSGDVAWSPGTGTVLLVEDQPQVRRALERILRDAGYEILSAEDGEQALELARKREGRIDLLVTDVIMPGISGIELCRRLLAQEPSLAVLLMSGYTGSEITLLKELGDCAQFLQKPFNAASLTAAAQAAIQRARAGARKRPPVDWTN